MFCRPFRPAVLLWLAFVSLAPVFGASAQAPSAMRVKVWTTDDGLPGSRVSCVAQAADGYLWAGTWAGLARFDGARFTVFTKYNTPQLVSDAINALVRDTDGKLWVGTKDGLVSWNDHQFTRATLPPDWPGRDVWRLVASRLGGLWVQCSEGVARFRGGKFSRLYTPQCPGLNRIVDLEEASDGGVNIYMNAAVLRIGPDLGPLRTNYIGDFRLGNWRAGLAADAPDSFWVGTEKGLARLDAPGVSGFVPELKNRIVDRIFRDRTGRLWASAHPGGLFCEQQGHWENVGSGTEVNDCMAEDLEGSLWVGSEQGLVQLQRTPVGVYTIKEGLVSDTVLSVCESADGSIWAGTQHGLNRILPSGVVASVPSEPAPDYPDRAVWPSQNGGLWIAKSGQGIIELQKGSFSSRARATEMRGLANCLYGDRSGRIWAGIDPGALIFDPDGKRRLHSDMEHDFRCFLEEPDGTFWFGTKKHGLIRVKNGDSVNLTQRDGLSYNDVWCLFQDSERVIWIGTDDGLTRYKDGRFFPYYVRHGLVEHTINCIVGDDAGNLWVSGLHGIYRFERKQLNDVAEGRARRVEPLAIGTADGMLNAETNGGENQPAGWKARDGRLWFPTVHGVVVFDPKSFPLKGAPAPVVIEQVKADADVVAGDPVLEDPILHQQPRHPGPIQKAVGYTNSGNYRLSAAHAIQFRYTANSFLEPRHVRFRYRLVGMEEDWGEITTEQTATYFNLRPGHYRFEVTAANPHNTWNPEPAGFSFYLAPRFWQTSVFYVLCGASIIGLGGAIQAYRLRWQHRLLKLEQQRALATERARIARDLHDDLGTALTGLALELDVVGRETRSTNGIGDRLKAAARRTRDLAERMREVVWTVNPRCDTVSSLASFLEQQVSQFLRADGLRVRLDFPEDIPTWPLAADTRHQLALAVREALANVVRHARASEVLIQLALEDRNLVVLIQDNGTGFAPLEQEGHGLSNMRSRLERIGGTFTCVSNPGAGATLVFRVPLPQVSAGEGK